MNINELMIKIIQEKFDILRLGDVDKRNKFWQINFFEGNAVGQIGEKFIKQIFIQNNIPFDKTADVVHDEYDLISNGKKIEIKTARQGHKNNTFQFNGINPAYNNDLIICIGIANNTLYYHIFKHSDIKYYHHPNRKYKIKLSDSRELALVEMNPNNKVNHKVTINVKDLSEVNQDFPKEILKALN